MPELPEVETVVRQLRRSLVGQRVRSIILHTPSTIRCRHFPARRLIGCTIRAVRRRGKFIRLDLAAPSRSPQGTGVTVLVHLRMTGSLRIHAGRPPRERHDHIDLVLDGRPEPACLRFSDIRKFGGWWLLPGDVADAAAPLAALGPEPLEISRDDFRRLLAGHKQRVKTLLLDQRRLAGMGNIYTDEALFAAGIHPEARACDVPAAKVDALWRAMRRILRAAIRHCGSSTSDFVGADGRRGRYQEHHQVYGRADQPCRRCGARLKYLRVAGRGTTFCPRCQALQRGRKKR